VTSQNETESIKKIGNNLRNIRKRLNLTLENVEERGWTNHKHLQRIEMGHKDVRISTLIRLSRIYEVSLNEILYDLETLHKQ